MLIDKALTRGYVPSPLAAPHHRREGLVFRGPSDKGKQSRPSPGGGRGPQSLTYEQSCARRRAGPISVIQMPPKRKPARDRHRDRSDRPPARPPSVECSHWRRPAVAAARLAQQSRQDWPNGNKPAVSPATRRRLVAFDRKSQRPPKSTLPRFHSAAKEKQRGVAPGCGRSSRASTSATSTRSDHALGSSSAIGCTFEGRSAVVWRQPLAPHAAGLKVHGPAVRRWVYCRRVSEWSKQVLQPFGVERFGQLWDEPLATVVAKLDDADLHVGDALLAVLVLKAVEELRVVSADMAKGTAATDEKTGRLLRAAWLTLLVAVVTLASTIVIAIAQ